MDDQARESNMLSHALCIASVVLSEVPNLAGVCWSGGFVGERRAEESSREKT